VVSSVVDESLVWSILKPSRRSKNFLLITDVILDRFGLHRSPFEFDERNESTQRLRIEINVKIASASHVDAITAIIEFI
jgi:hypothetical protein